MSLLLCLACGRTLQVPVELLGRMVKCPSCGQAFTAPSVAPPAQSPAPSTQPWIPEWSEWEAPIEPRSRGQRLRQRVRPRVLPPAIALVVLSSLALPLELFNSVYAVVAPPPRVNPNDPPFVQEFQKGTRGPAAFVVQSGFAVVAVVILVGAIQMIRVRTWGLALTSAILAMVHVGSCCCLFGIPFGIWALIVLCDAEV